MNFVDVKTFFNLLKGTPGYPTVTIRDAEAEAVSWVRRFRTRGWVSY